MSFISPSLVLAHLGEEKRSEENILFDGINLVATGVNIRPSNKISYLRYERSKNGLDDDDDDDGGITM